MTAVRLCLFMNLLASEALFWDRVVLEEHCHVPCYKTKPLVVRISVKVTSPPLFHGFPSNTFPRSKVSPVHFCHAVILYLSTLCFPCFYHLSHNSHLVCMFFELLLTLEQGGA